VSPPLHYLFFLSGPVPVLLPGIEAPTYARRCVRLVITSVKEVMFSTALVCLFVISEDYAKNAQPILTKFGGNGYGRKD